MAVRILIQKSDIKQYFPFSENVSDSDIVLFMKNAQVVEFKSWTPTDFYTDLVGTLTSKPELLALLNDYIKPYLCSEAYYNFLLWHGRKVTAGGLKQTLDATTENVSDKARAELLQDVERQRNIFLSMLKRRLSEDSYTYDGVVYDFNQVRDSKKPKTNIGIFQVGRFRNIPHNPNKPCNDECY